MHEQFDLIDYLDRYPVHAGYKDNETSKQAAEEIEQSGRAAHLRELVKQAFRICGPMTADECADYLGEDKLSIRPRLSELNGDFLIKTQQRRKHPVTGKTHAVYQLAKEGDVKSKEQEKIEYAHRSLSGLKIQYKHLENAIKSHETLPFGEGEKLRDQIAKCVSDIRRYGKQLYGTAFNYVEFING